MEFLHELTIKKFHQGLANKEFSAFEIAKAYFDLIEKEDGKIKAYLSVDKDSAFTQAEKVDLALAKDEKLSMLAGAPLAIKDNILIQDFPCTAASKILKNYLSAYDAAIIKKLKEVQAVFLGKTNMDEFAHGSSTENSAFQTTRNPYDLERVAGGSSGGSAAAVAANMALAALGSDTGGSIRLPASFCGVVGLKPTYGAVSRFGLIAMASSLDQIGPIAKTVEDAAILFKGIAGRDDSDPTSQETDYGHEILEPDFAKVKKMKIGLPKEYFVSGLDKKTEEAIEETIKKFRSLGIEIKEINLPHTKYAMACYYIIMPAEVSSNLARFDGVRYSPIPDGGSVQSLKDLYFQTRGRGFGKEAKRRIILGTFVLSSGYYDAYYKKAQKVRRLITEDFETAFSSSGQGVDAILAPVSPVPAFKIGEKTKDPLSMYLSDIFTVSANLAGVPAISIPVKKYSFSAGRDELPLSFQLIGRHFKEADILSLGQYYERI